MAGGSEPLSTLRLSIVFHPCLERIGRYADLGRWSGSGFVGERIQKVGRAGPLFSDGLGLDEGSVSRESFKLSADSSGIRLVQTGSSDVRIGIKETSSQVLDLEQLSAGVAIRLGHAVVLFLRLIPLNGPSVEPSRPSYFNASNDAKEWLGESPEAQRVRQLADFAASTDLPVLLLGASGVGKELLAQRIHNLSARSDRPLVPVNMAAIPEGLAPAELFGASNGAYTGAKAREGFFQKAHLGSLFLDEIGDCPAVVQTPLLRALQEGELQVVGGALQKVDVRVIAATDARVDKAAGFHQALLQRLAGVTISIPPLASRLEDLGVLVRAQLNRANLNSDWFSADSQRAARWARMVFNWLHHDWPGNSRELLNTAKRALLGDPTQLTQRYEIVAEEEAESFYVTDAQIITAWHANDFETTATANALGIPRPTVHRRVQGIPECRLAKDVPTAELILAVDQFGYDAEQISRALKVSKHGVSSRLRTLDL